MVQMQLTNELDQSPFDFVHYHYHIGVHDGVRDDLMVLKAFHCLHGMFLHYTARIPYKMDCNDD